jgi:hypothetical protein
MALKANIVLTRARQLAGEVRGEGSAVLEGCLSPWVTPELLGIVRAGLANGLMELRLVGEAKPQANGNPAPKKT